MSLVPAYPFTQIRELVNPAHVFNQAMGMLTRLAKHGLIHCDLNEFNLLIDDSEKLTMIDFPQMVSTSHPDAKMYFERDADCLRVYFARKFGLGEEDDGLDLFRPVFEELGVGQEAQLDTALKASGFTKEDNAALLKALAATCEAEKEGEGGEEEEEEDEEEEGEEEENEGAMHGDEEEAGKRSSDPTSTSKDGFVELECMDEDEDSEEEDELTEAPYTSARGASNRPSSARANSARARNHADPSKKLRNKKQSVGGFRKSNRNKLVGKEKSKATRDNDGW